MTIGLLTAAMTIGMDAEPCGLAACHPGHDGRAGSVRLVWRALSLIVHPALLSLPRRFAAADAR